MRQQLKNILTTRLFWIIQFMGLILFVTFTWFMNYAGSYAVNHVQGQCPRLDVEACSYDNGIAPFVLKMHDAISDKFVSGARVVFSKAAGRLFSLFGFPVSPGGVETAASLLKFLTWVITVSGIATTAIVLRATRIEKSRP